MDDADFKILPFSQIRDLELPHCKIYGRVENVIDFYRKDDVLQCEAVEELENELMEMDPSNLLDNQSIWGRLYSLTVYFDRMCAPAQSSIVTTVSTLLGSILGALQRQSVGAASQTAKLRASYKATVYLLSYLIVAAEKVASKQRGAASTQSKASRRKRGNATEDTFEWSGERKAQHIRALLGAIWTASADNSGAGTWVDIGKMWNCGLPDESFVNLFWQTAEALIENASNVKSEEVRRALIDLIAAPAHRFHSLVAHNITSSFAHMLERHEHLPSFVAEMCSKLGAPAEKCGFGDSKLTRDLVLEVGLREAASDVAVMKNRGAFIEELSQMAPESVLTNLSVILPHLSGEHYAMRSSIVRSVAKLAAFLVADSRSRKSDESRDVELRDKLLGVLCERTQDVSSWVRSTSLKEYSSLVREGVLPISHFHIATDLAAERVIDKSSIVRKQAIHLLGSLLDCNPYNGDLTASLYEGKINDVLLWFQEHEGDESEEAERTRLGKTEFLGYCKSAVNFISKIEIACKECSKLLSSKSTTDVVESVRFFVKAQKFKLFGATKGLNQMLGLIWDTRDSGSVKKELMLAFETVYVKCGDRMLGPSAIAKNLTRIALGATLAELTSLEEVVAEAMKSNGVLGRKIIPATAIQCLWEMSSDSDVCAAISVLGMAAAVQPVIIGKQAALVRICAILDGALQQQNYTVARCAFRAIKAAALAALAKKRTFAELCGNDCTDAVDSIISKISDLICSKAHRDAKSWPSMAESGIDLIFMLHGEPELFCGNIVRQVHAKTFSGAFESLPMLFFLAGHVAVKTLVYGERLASKAQRVRSQMKTSAENKGDEEFDFLGACGEDDIEQSVLSRLADKELVATPSRLLGLYAPLLLRVIAEPRPTFLHQSALLAFVKYMVVSESFCTKHLRLLFTLLERSEEPSTRANIVIALGDICFRFPNVAEPYSSEIYKRLRDANPGVRKNTLMVLTHLILNDQIKSRGQVFEIAICLQDPDVRIRDLASLFFSELSKRNAVLKNLLPDCIGRLSCDRIVSNRMFKDIAQFLMAFITKDAHTMQLTEQFCKRIYRASNKGDMQDARNYMHCIGLMRLGDKTLRKLGDSLYKFYAPSLADDDFYVSFQHVLSRAKQFCSKTEVKGIVEEMNSRAQRARNENDGEAEAPREASTPSKVAAQRIDDENENVQNAIA